MSTSERRRRQGLAALVLLAMAVITTGGCDVQVESKSSEHGDRASRLLEGGLSVDLRTPPSREDLAGEEGRSQWYLELEGREEFDVEVRFDDGRALRTPAYVVGVGADGGEGPPTSLTVRRDGLTVDGLRTILETAVTDLGADRAQVDAFLEQAEQAGERDFDLIRSVRTDLRGEDGRLTLEPVVSADEGRVSVNYLVDWTAP